MRIDIEKIPEGIRDHKVAVVGYGLIGKPVALCLRDSGHDVRIGLRSGSTSYEKVRADDFQVQTIDDAAKWADAVFLHIPDDQQGRVYKDFLDKNMQENSILILAHGYSFLYEEIEPRDDIDAVVIAPHGPGKALRELYEKGKGLAAQIAVHHDHTGDAEARALHLARALGHHHGGINITSVRDEVVMDNFAEQMVLCGGVVELMRSAYQSLVNSGYDPESAYESVVNELKYTVDLIHESGPSGLYRQISKSALVGSLLFGSEAVGDDARKRMKSVLTRIESGEFKTLFQEIMSKKKDFDIDQKIKELQDDFK